MNHPYYVYSNEPMQPSEPPSDPEEARYHFSKLGLAYLAMTASLLAVAYAVRYAVRFLRPEWLGQWWLSWALSLLPLYGVGLPVLWLCLRKLPTSPHNTDYPTRATLFIPAGVAEKPRLSFGNWMILLIIAFGCMTVGGLIGNFIMLFLSALRGYDYAFALNGMVNETPVWVTFICTCICAPFGEELLFRKLLIDRTRHVGDLPAILLSGILFGLFHGNLFQLFYATMVGMILAYVYTRSGSYLWCVAMHAVINFMGSIVTPALSELAMPLLSEEFMQAPVDEWTGGAALLVMVVAYLFLFFWQNATLVGGIVLFAVFFRKRKLSRGQMPLAGSEIPSTILFNPGVVAYMAITLLMVAVNLLFT